jgi:holo-[acyl-carrier protein] synthase
VETVQDAIDVHGRRYLKRVYSERELAECRSDGTIDARRLAGCFAAKEATMKVIDPRDDALAWGDLEVCGSDTGWPEMTLRGQAATLAESRGVSRLALSLTRERGNAAAVVIAEINGACR